VFPLSSNGNPDKTIACNWPIMLYGGDTQYTICTKPQSFTRILLYPVNCVFFCDSSLQGDNVAVGCSGNACWCVLISFLFISFFHRFPAEKRSVPLIVKSGGNVAFSVTGFECVVLIVSSVHHECDCSMVECNSFVDIIARQGDSVPFPVGNTNHQVFLFIFSSLFFLSLQSCHFSSISVIIGDLSYLTTSVSTSCLSGQYDWRINYSMTRFEFLHFHFFHSHFSVPDSWSFQSSPKKLCVLSPPSKVFLFGSGLTRITSTDSSNLTEYILSSPLSFKPQSPQSVQSPCPSFSIQSYLFTFFTSF
jgi:hypothetical protein